MTTGNVTAASLQDLAIPPMTAAFDAYVTEILLSEQYRLAPVTADHLALLSMPFVTGENLKLQLQVSTWMSLKGLKPRLL